MGLDLRTGPTELLVLSVLRAQPLHGYAIKQDIERRTYGEIDLSPGPLYSLLRALEAQGLLTSEWERSAGERRRRVYRITPAGRRALGELRDSWVALATAVTRVVEA